ncbi:MAG: hypothetical protein Phog2KO_03010 [Phototrophicaceae bacterium]
MVVIGIAVPSLIIIPLLPKLIQSGRDSFVDVDLGIVEYTVGDGDIFEAQHGTIAPPPNPEEVLSRHRLAWDSDGFRLPAQVSDNYTIIALGDSYTEASGVNLPWSDILARELDEPVRNLGYRGYGPQEYAIVMEEYGIAENPDVVVIGFFGGNDISNAGSFSERSDSFILPELARDTIAQAFDGSEAWDTDLETYQYPVYLELQGNLMPVAFLNSYVNWLNITQEDLLQSFNMQEILQSWRTIHDLAGEACVVIAYFPSKPQVYLPYVIEENRSVINVGQVQRVSEPNTVIETADIEPTYQTLLERIPNVPTALAQVANDENMLFLDLLPAFQVATENGEMLYPSYDTHWNQVGHELVGTEISTFIEQNCP